MEKVKVNWFQQEIDDPDRNWSYLEKQGNLLKFLLNRHQWYCYPKISKVGEFPLHVDLEISAACDLECPMCPRRHADTSGYGLMDFGLFKRLVDEAAANRVFSARLSWRGEVFNHPQFSEFARYIKKNGNIPQVSFLTNGQRMTEEIAQDIVDIGIDYVSFSVDGVGRMYEIIREPLKFDKLLNSIKMLKEARDRSGKKKPQIRVCGLWPAIAQNPEEYFKIMKPLADKIVANPLRDYRITKQTKFNHNYTCQFLWQRLFVGYDGRVQPCSNSIERLYIGDANINKLSEIWKGDEINKIRKAHIEGRSDEYFACSQCTYKSGENYLDQLNRNWTDWDPRVLAEKREE